MPREDLANNNQINGSARELKKAEVPQEEVERLQNQLLEEILNESKNKPIQPEPARQDSNGAKLFILACATAAVVIAAIFSDKLTPLLPEAWTGDPEADINYSYDRNWPSFSLPLPVQQADLGNPDQDELLQKAKANPEYAYICLAAETSCKTSAYALNQENFEEIRKSALLYVQPMAKTKADFCAAQAYLYFSPKMPGRNATKANVLLRKCSESFPEDKNIKELFELTSHALKPK